MRRTNNQVRTVPKPFEAEAARAAAQPTKMEMAQKKSEQIRKCRNAVGQKKNAHSFRDAVCDLLTVTHILTETSKLGEP